MGRAPCCDKANVKRGPWSPDEDATLKNYLHKYGTGGNWISLPQRAGLKRCGKSCRLRWLNYLRPDIKHGSFSEDEDNTIISLYSKMGSRWSVIAANLPGRTDNDVKNHWNTKLKKKLFGGCNNNNKSNSLITPKIANLFPNDTTNPTITNQQPSSSTPSPNYVVNYPNYHNQVNYQHQFYTPLPSFSSLLSQCTNNTPPMSLTSNFNSLTSFDHIYANADQVCSSVSSCQTPLKQQVLMPNYSCSVGPIANLCSTEEVSSISELSTNLYGSSLEADHQLLDVLGFGFAQDVLVTSNCNYGGDADQVDIKPQGLGQDLTN